jgi:SAM-dependent methyltransferase
MRMRNRPKDQRRSTLRSSCRWLPPRALASAPGEVTWVGHRAGGIGWIEVTGYCQHVAVDEYLLVNRANWDERAPLHAASAAYAVERFVTDREFLSGVVRFDLPRLGDVAGLLGVHLQCHIGTDTVSLARLGARMTGVDLSPASLAEARRLAAAVGSNVEFVESDVYSVPDHLPRAAFDLVYTGIGALCWLPDVRRWAQVVADLLRPGGRLFLREGHPVLWSVDDRREELVIDFAYAEIPEPAIWENDSTYVETATTLTHTTTHSWNHGLGEIVTALLESGMELTQLVEHDSVPWEALPGKMERTDRGEWRLADRPWRLPHTYTLQAIRRGH